MSAGLVALPLVLVMIVAFVFWRCFWFFRDPERSPPPEEGAVSAADGIVVYVHHVTAGHVPISIKKGSKIKLSELQGLPELAQDGILIGVFMTALDVHVNRAPIEGRIEKCVFSPPRENCNMGRMFINLLARRFPVETDCKHLVENERNSIVIKGEMGSCVVTQIADRWVRRIFCGVNEGEEIGRGARIGSILLGSQVDVFIQSRCYSPSVKPGQRVRAGETIIAKLGA